MGGVHSKGTVIRVGRLFEGGAHSVRTSTFLFLIEIHTLLTMLTNITDNTNINLTATYTTSNIHAVIYTTYNTSYLRLLQY